MINYVFQLVIAFLGGVLAFFSPCFLPLIPAYLIFITGLSFDEVKNIPLKTVSHSLTFILGFTIVFTFLGITVSLIGDFLYSFKDIIRVIGGGIIIILGLYLLGIIKLGFLNIEKKLTISSKPAGYLGTLLVGMAFAIGWSPCVGPILAGILFFASQAGTVVRGTLMLVAFSFGLGFPLLIFSLAINYSLSLLKKIEKYLGLIHSISGVFLVIVGILLATDLLQKLSIWLINITGYKGI